MKLLDGLALANKIQAEIACKVEDYTSKNFRGPQLDVILVGDNPASKMYVDKKAKAGHKCGITVNIHHYDSKTTHETLCLKIDELNKSSNCDGILVQLPLPEHLNSHQILMQVSPLKDVDGLHPNNLGLLASAKPGLMPCTPLGVITLLKHYDYDFEGKKACVIGRSNLVGRPVSLMLTNLNATVTLCHSKTSDLSTYTKAADLIIVAIGQPHFLNSSHISSGVALVDVGTNYPQTPNLKSKVLGDIDFDSVSEKASLITPVPGGIGPMTVTMLLQNTFKVYHSKMSQNNT